MKFRDLLQDLLEEQLPCQKVVTYDMLKQAKDWWLNRLRDPDILMKIIRARFTVDEIKTWTDKKIDETLRDTLQDLQAANKKIDLINGNNAALPPLALFSSINQNISNADSSKISFLIFIPKFE